MNLASPLPAQGVLIPIYATFTGWERIPFWAMSTNSYKPVLRLFETEVEFKVMKTHRRALSDIKRVDAFRGWGTNIVIVMWKDTSLTFTANVIRADWQWQVLKFFEGKGIALAPRAAQFAQEGPPAPKVKGSSS